MSFKIGRFAVDSLSTQFAAANVGSAPREERSERMTRFGALVNKRLLLVEDETDLRELLVSSFERAGCEVFSASNGTKAFEIVCREALDLVISDIRMAGGDGIELLKNIKRRSADGPVVMLMTGYTNVAFEEAYALGAAAILPKPFDLDEIEEAAARLLSLPAKPHVPVEDRRTADAGCLSD